MRGRVVGVGGVLLTCGVMAARQTLVLKIPVRARAGQQKIYSDAMNNIDYAKRYVVYTITENDKEDDTVVIHGCYAKHMRAVVTARKVGGLIFDIQTATSEQLELFNRLTGSEFGEWLPPLIGTIPINRKCLEQLNKFIRARISEQFGGIRINSLQSLLRVNYAEAIHDVYSGKAEFYTIGSQVAADIIQHAAQYLEMNLR